MVKLLNADEAEFAELSTDSVEDTNLFSYCNNNPVMGTDPEGNLSNGWKIAITGALLVASVAVIVATGGVASGPVMCAAISAAEGAIDGAFSGAISGAVCGVLKPTHCFVAGTAVLAAVGYVTIEDIRKGDYVWSWDEETGEKALKQVTETYVSETDELVHLYARGEQIDTTPGHPFYVDGKGWYPAESLRAGDILVTINGERVILELVQHEILESPINVYNLEVQDYHTYCVAICGILGHNGCGDYKKINETEFEKKNQLKKGEFHNDIKKLIKKKQAPGQKVGSNPDIMLNRKGRIGYQTSGKSSQKKFQETELYIQDILAEFRKRRGR